MNKGTWRSLLPGLTANQSGLDTLSQGDNGMSAELMRTFNPQTFARMWGWWKADEGIVTVSGLVSTWTSVVNSYVDGTRIVFRQTTAAERPVYRPNGKNSFPYIEFNSASTQWLTNSSAPLIGADSVWIIVVRARSISASSKYILGSRSSTETNLRYQVVGGLNTLIYRIGGSTPLNITEKSNLKFDEFSIHYFGAVIADHNAKTNLNKKVNVLYSTPATSSYNLASRFTGPSQNGDVDIAEILCFGSSLTEDQYIRTFNYLKQKYKIVQ